jgi:FecR protein
MKNISENRFKLSPRGVMLALVSAALSDSAFANTGHVDFAIGNVTVTQANGRARALARGAEVGSGDKIASGADGRAQIRFSDGAYVSVQPNTEFDIKQYRFNGKADGSESALFGLFKGALRTVTGLVGRTNRNKYQIATPTATIGIRGTGGLIQIGNDGSTLVVGSSGIWTLTNNGGTIDVPAGTAGFAGANRNVPPRLTTGGPLVPPPQPQTGVQPPTFVAGDKVGPLGNTIVPSGGPGYAVAFFGAGTPPLANPSNTVFDSAGQLMQFDQSITALTTYKLSGTQVDTGTDGFLSWGRWTSGVSVNGTPVTLNANQGLHYVAGVPTPSSSMPTNGTFTYNLVGGTSPTFANGLASPGTLNSATLTGDFLQRTVAINLSATALGSTLAATAAGTIASGLPTFNASGTVPSVSGGSLSCSGCSVQIGGFFSGAGATNAGMAYQVNGVFSTQTGSTSLMGTAALAR